MTELNDDCDSLSYFSSNYQKENHILFNQSFHYEKEIIMNDFNTELENKNNLIAFENIFSNKKDKLEAKGEITHKNNNQRRNLPTNFTEQRRTKKKIFKIIETKFNNKHYKKKGRKRKNSTSEPAKRNKNCEDNIRNRIINIFINRIQIYINSKLSKAKLKKIKKIISIHKKYPGIEKLKIFLKKKIGEIFSEPLSDRCTKFAKDYNKNLINNWRNDTNLIEINNILDQTVEQMFGNYISNSIPDFSLNKDLQKIKKEDENYAENFKNNAVDFVKLIYEKKGRKRKNKLKE